MLKTSHTVLVVNVKDLKRRFTNDVVKNHVDMLERVWKELCYISDRYKKKESLRFTYPMTHVKAT